MFRRKKMFITLEGIEGSGKTTQIPFISEFLNKNQIKNITTREPGDTEIGKDIRSILLNSAKSIDPLTELLLYSADRAEHIKSVILPSIKKNISIICDRFIDSTIVYQGYGRKIDFKTIDIIHSIESFNIKPDITFLLDLDPQTGLNRTFKDVNTGKRSTDQMRFENEKIDFHNRIREGYLKIAASEPDRVKIIDGNLEIKDITEQILFHLNKLVNTGK